MKKLTVKKTATCLSVVFAILGGIGFLLSFLYATDSIDTYFRRGAVLPYLSLGVCLLSAVCGCFGVWNSGILPKKKGKMPSDSVKNKTADEKETDDESVIANGIANAGKEPLRLSLLPGAVAFLIAGVLFLMFANGSKLAVLSGIFCLISAVGFGLLLLPNHPDLHDLAVLFLMVGIVGEILPVAIAYFDFTTKINGCFKLTVQFGLLFSMCFQLLFVRKLLGKISPALFDFCSPLFLALTAPSAIGGCALFVTGGAYSDLYTALLFPTIGIFLVLLCRIVFSFFGKTESVAIPKEDGATASEETD